MSRTAGVLSTPGGDLAVIADGETVVASGYVPLVQLLSELGAGETDSPAEAPTEPLAEPIREAVAAYARGELDALDRVAVAQPGADFTQGVWEAMRRIPPGQALTYGELAALVGRPAATRAVGQACARNRVAPFVPCHRVVPSSGGVGSYAYGTDVKVSLLRHEGWSG